MIGSRGTSSKVGLQPNPSNRRVRPWWFAGPLLVTACALEGTADPPMDVQRFDPSHVLEAVRRYAGPSAELIGFEARFVRSDGTMDLTAAYHPTLEYDFVRPNTSQEDAPIGTGKSDRAFELIEIDVHEPHWVHVKRFGGGCSGTFHDLGMERDVSFGGRSYFDRRTSPPSCSLAAVWKLARDKAEIPDGAVAVIEFSGAGFEFEIHDLDVELWFSPACEPLDEAAFDAREAELAISPEERVKQARERAEAEQRAAAAETERLAREAQRDAQLEQVRQQAIERIRAAQGKSQSK